MMLPARPCMTAMLLAFVAAVCVAAWQEAEVPLDETTTQELSAGLRPALPVVDGVVDLSPLTWWLDGKPFVTDEGFLVSAEGTSVGPGSSVLISMPKPPRAVGSEGDETLELTWSVESGSWPRWSAVFTTEEACMARLGLEWEGGPDGALFEVVLDGRRLSPPRDGWRPHTQKLRSDLGPAWLGAGRHLLEFVLRERSVPATLRLKRLHVTCQAPL